MMEIQSNTILGVVIGVVLTLVLEVTGHYISKFTDKFIASPINRWWARRTKKKIEKRQYRWKYYASLRLQELLDDPTEVIREELRLDRSRQTYREQFALVVILGSGLLLFIIFVIIDSPEILGDIAGIFLLAFLVVIGLGIIINSFSRAANASIDVMFIETLLDSYDAAKDLVIQPERLDSLKSENESET